MLLKESTYCVRIKKEIWEEFTFGGLLNVKKKQSE